jgi:hypothetical protein
MVTNSGLIELDCGWVLGVASPVPDQVRLVLQFDPRRELFANGVKDLRLSTSETRELLQALTSAVERATERNNT